MANQSMNSSYLTTKSSLAKKTFHTPFSGPDAIPAVIGHIGRIRDYQAAAATLTTKRVATHDGKVRKLLIATADLAAATETLAFDVQLNGVTILSATPQLVTTDSVVGVYDFISLLAAVTSIKVGDVISIIRTLANGSTLTSTELIMEWG